MSRYGYDSDYRQGERDFENGGRNGADWNRMNGWGQDDRDYQSGFEEARREAEREEQHREERRAEEARQEAERIEAERQEFERRNYEEWQQEQAQQHPEEPLPEPVIEGDVNIFGNSIIIIEPPPP